MNDHHEPVVGVHICDASYHCHTMTSAACSMHQVELQRIRGRAVESDAFGRWSRRCIAMRLKQTKRVAQTSVGKARTRMGIDWSQACKSAYDRSLQRLQENVYGGCAFAVRAILCIRTSCILRWLASHALHRSPLTCLPLCTAASYRLCGQDGSGGNGVTLPSHSPATGRCG
jgi:hypothetical protein